MLYGKRKITFRIKGQDYGLVRESHGGVIKAVNAGGKRLLINNRKFKVKKSVY